METKQLNVDKKKFIKSILPLFGVYSTPGSEDEMRDYLSKQLKSIKKIDWYIDDIGNIIGERNKNKTKQVILNSHMDSWMNPVTPEYRKALGYYPKEDVITNPGFMIGCDDKVGIGIILFLLKNTDLDMKFIFTVCEEKGCVGVSNLDPKVYDDALFAVTLDRANSGDIIQTYLERKMISDEMVTKIGHLSNQTYKMSPGIFADTYHIAEYIPAFNLSVGYYNQHRKNDYVKIDEALNALQLTYNLILNKEEMSINAEPEIITEIDIALNNSFKLETILA
jgi:putative aminopeptidase FrvX